MLRWITILMFLATSAFPGELETRAEIRNKVRDMLLGEEFAELDALAVQYRDNQSRTPSGLWKLTFFYEGLSTALNARGQNDRQWVTLDAITSAYLEQRPQSATAIIMRANYLLDLAWNIRGNKYSREVTRSAWQRFYEKVVLPISFYKRVKI